MCTVPNLTYDHLITIYNVTKLKLHSYEVHCSILKWIIIKYTFEALCYKPEDRGFYSRWCHWKFYWHNPSGRTMTHVVDQAYNWNEYQEDFLGGKGGLCVGLTILSSSCADCLETLELQPNGTLWACKTPVQRLLYFYQPYICVCAYVITTYSAPTCNHVIIICNVVSYTHIIIICTVVRYTH
jgi:hypothetical protein